MINVGLISLSTGWLPRLENRPYYELSAALTVMGKFWKEALVDGFEFGLLPEWNSENPPLTPSDASLTCEKHPVQEILKILQESNLRFLSVHANRDLGCYLCSNEQTKRSQGVKLTNESLRFCESLDSKICTLHFWDPWSTNINLAHLCEVYKQARTKFPQLQISVENIPTAIKGETPFNLMREFDHKTLDLKWASMYNEFDNFVNAIEKVGNVHIQGKYQNGDLVCTTGDLDYSTALQRIMNSGYSGIFTVELEGRATYKEIKTYIERLRKLIG